MSDEFILVDTSDDPAAGATVPSDGSRGNWGSEVQRGLQAAGLKRLSVAELEQKMGNFLQVVTRLFRQAEQQAQLEQQSQQQAGQTAKARLKLDEVELAVEITAGGEIKLVAGGKAEAKGAIKLKFKRVEL
jgi:hypothetical protein